jgi:hypothetical protein
VGTQHRDVIEINGKKYDAVTGRMIKDEPSAPTPAVQAQTITPIKKTGAVLDGFTRRHPAASPNHPKEQHHNEAASHTGIDHKKQVQKSKTLMRSVVKKPAPTTVPAPVSTQKQIHKIATNTPPERQHVAHTTAKSPLVSHFSPHQARSSVVKKVEHLPVKGQQPLKTAEVTAAVTQSNSHRTSSDIQKHTASNLAVAKALAHATSHEQHSPQVHKKSRRRKLAHKLGITSRAMAVSSSVLAAVLLIGFFAIQNVPNLSMRVAAARAGVHASMPGYQPAGYSFKGPIQYGKGQVTISFASRTDGRNYSVTQKETRWNSDALLTNYVMTEKKQYQTYVDRGRTLYIYNGSNATWVDNGIWYQVEGDSQMTTDQLVRIAASI